MKTMKFISAAVIAAGLSSQQVALTQTSTEPMNPEVNNSSYRTAIGLRAGGTSGLTFKHFFKETSAFEGILGIWPNAVGFTGLYEKHQRAFDLDEMRWYYGVGGHVSFETRNVYYVYRDGDRYFYRYRAGGGTGIGIDGILGLEYKIKPIPFAISLDMKPFIEVKSDRGIYMSLDPGLGVKIAF